MDHLYWLKGSVSVPENRKEELNENVLKLLKQCGIRKLKEIQMDGKTITVVHEPKPDDKGIVSFDYSVFEKQKREISYYNMTTCELHITDRGYGEFGVAMNLVMTMLEAYSAKHCYLMFDNEVCDIYGYALLIEQMIGLRLSFPNREKVWDMLTFFKSNEKYSEMTYDELWDKFPYGYGKIDLDQSVACLICDEETAEKPENYIPPKKSEIKHTKTRQKVYYAYELFQDFIKERGKNEAQAFLKNLLELNRLERELLAQEEDVCGCIAEISLYELPSYLVTAYGWAVQEEFWSIWFSLGIKGYHDIYKKDRSKNATEKEEQTQKQRLFYKIIQRSCEDEFLEFLDNQELCLSDSMAANLEEWKHMYENVNAAEAANNISVETDLADILLEMREIWNCRYVDEELVRDFLEHQNIPEYQKAIYVFQKIQNGILEYFPELTKNQVKEWVIKQFRSSKDMLSLSGYASLLTNRMRRADLLGF